MPELITIARIFVVVLGATLFVFAAWGFVNPRKLLQVVKATMDTDWGIWLAVVVRLLLGAALIIVAPAAAFPVSFVVIGWIAIAAAVAAVLLGRPRLRAFTNWWIDRFSGAGVRIWVLVALAFAGFLVYGAALFEKYPLP